MAKAAGHSEVEQSNRSVHFVVCMRYAACEYIMKVCRVYCIYVAGTGERYLFVALLIHFKVIESLD